MKTLKKILSLVLVVAMIASMMIVGAAAADEVTNYEEAAAVVTGIGIIEGDGTGYNYQGLLTREQAAKIITYMLLGKSTAESLKVSSAPFADVAASRWSAPYIAYLKGQGIISGVSDTEFDPTANVTGVQLAKMMLSAVGYGAAGEFEGAAWDINTITFANDTGLYDGTLAATPADDATREEAMLYMFNVLTKIPVVKYNKTFESYYTGSSALNPVEGAVDPSAPIVDVDGVETATPYAYTLGYTKYALVKDTSLGNIDDFGRPSATWTAVGGVEVENVSTAEPVFVYGGQINSATLFAVLGKNVCKNLSENMGNATQYVDGAPGAAPITAPIAASEFMANVIGAAGATVELYLSRDLYTGDYHLRVVTYYEYFGEVQKVTTTAAGTTLKIAGEAEIDGEDVDITGLKKGDYVLYTKGADGVATVKAVTPVSGVYTSLAEGFATTYTVGGVPYALSTKHEDVDTVLAANFGSTFDLYLDSQGNAIYAKLTEEGEASNQYLYVIKADAQPYEEGVLNGKEAKVALTVVYPDGGQEVLYYAVKHSSAYEAADEETGGYYIVIDGDDYVLTSDNTTAISDGDVLKGWYRFTTNDAGAVTLKGLNPTYAEVTDVELATGKAYVDGTYSANASTVLNIIDAKGTVISYTGASNFIPTEGTAMVTYGLNSKTAKTINIFVPNFDFGSNVVYATGVASTDADGVYYSVYVDGIMQNILTDDADLAAADGSGVFYMVVENGEYDFTPVGAYAPGTDNEDDDAADCGTVNYGSADIHLGDGVPFDFTYFFSYLPVSGVGNTKMYWNDFSSEYYEWATIADIDDNFFTTVEVDVDGYEEARAAFDEAFAAWIVDYTNPELTEVYNEATAALAELMSDTVSFVNTDAYTYYFDGNTEIYDISGQGKTELSEGDVFVAYIDETVPGIYNGDMYASIIWIIA